MNKPTAERILEILREGWKKAMREGRTESANFIHKLADDFIRRNGL